VFFLFFHFLSVLCHDVGEYTSGGTTKLLGNAAQKDHIFIAFTDKIFSQLFNVLGCARLAMTQISFNIASSLREW
jgi:hypothetical protein